MKNLLCLFNIVLIDTGTSVGKRDFGSFHCSNVEELINMPDVSSYLNNSRYVYIVDILAENRKTKGDKCLFLKFRQNFRC